MAIALTAAITAILVGLSVAYVVRRSVNATFMKAIGGRSDAEPVGEHRRAVTQLTNESRLASNRATMLERALDTLTTGVIVTDQRGATVFRNRFASDITTRPHETALVEAKTSELLAEALRGRGQ